MSTYEISKSALISLKAEILRKQSEVKSAQHQNEAKVKRLKLKNQDRPTTNSVNSSTLTQISTDDDDLEVSERSTIDVRRSQQILEAKARLYDRLRTTARDALTQDEQEFNRRCLVRFPADSRQSNDVDNDDEEEKRTGRKEDVVEYTDCFGRTRQCQRKDLRTLQTNDKDLQEFVRTPSVDCPVVGVEEEDHNKEVEGQEVKKNSMASLGAAQVAMGELVSSDMRRECMRQQWDAQVDELSHKSNIHYQDVLFEEARSHGVGYFGFSTDVEERARQQAALWRLRDETKRKQRSNEEQRQQRDRAIAQRVLAAKNRRRARQGLPPLEDNDTQISSSTTTADNVKEETPPPSSGDEPLTAEEKRHQQARAQHVRPWDIGKILQNREHYEYSQEEWVTKKREERITEFAPPQQTYFSGGVGGNDDQRRKKPKRMEGEGSSVEARIGEGLRYIREQLESGNQAK